MSKRIAFVAVVCLCVGTAFGAAKKIRFFTPSQTQIDESLAALGPDADPDGMAILNHASGADKTIVQVIVSDMTPFLTYSVRLTDGTNEVVVSDAFTANDEGHGTFHQEFLETDISTYDVEMFVGTTASGVVWSQLQESGNLPSPYANTSLDTTGNAADDISFDSAQDITNVRWWGSWCNANPPSDLFRLRFYDDAGGVPGMVIYEQDNIAPTTKVSVGVPPVTVCIPTASEFEFEFDLPVAFTAAANTTYWIELVGKQNVNNAVFTWSNADSAESRGVPDGDGAGAQRNTPTGAWFAQPDRAFELTGESDTTEVRAAGSNPG